jgi:hypothetical protein
MPHSGRGNCFAGQVGEGRRGLYAIKRQAGMVRDERESGDTGPICPGWLCRKTAIDQVPMPDRTARFTLPWMMSETLNHRTMAMDQRHV